MRREARGDYHYPAHLEILDPGVWSGTFRAEGLPAPAGAASSFQAARHYTHHVTPLAGLRAALGDHVAVEYAPGCHDSDAADGTAPGHAPPARRPDTTAPRHAVPG